MIVLNLKIQEQLKQYGLLINNANIKELDDVGESKYFQNRRQKALAIIELILKIKK